MGLLDNLQRTIFTQVTFTSDISHRDHSSGSFLLSTIPAVIVTGVIVRGRIARVRIVLRENTLKGNYLGLVWSRLYRVPCCNLVNESKFKVSIFR